MAKFAEFTKIPDIVEAYESQGIPAFAIFLDSQLRVKWEPGEEEGIEEGADKLTDTLQRLEGSGSFAIYTLRVYENPKGTIKNNTPYDSSVNFQFNRQRSSLQAGMGSVETSYKGASYTDLAVENAILKKRVEDLEDELAKPESAEMGGVMGVIDKISGLPGMDNVIGAIAAKLAGLLTGGNPGPAQYDPRSTGHHEQPLSGSHSLSGIPEMDSTRRIELSISELSKSVKDLPEILEKLARMAKQQPFKFNLYISTLRKMSI